MARQGDQVDARRKAIARIDEIDEASIGERQHALFDRQQGGSGRAVEKFRAREVLPVTALKDVARSWEVRDRSGARRPHATTDVIAVHVRWDYEGDVVGVDPFSAERIEQDARKIPPLFPFDTIETTTDYDYVRLETQSFLLPVESEVLSCQRGTGICARNKIEFRNYRKFGSESDITFDNTAK